MTVIARRIGARCFDVAVGTENRVELLEVIELLLALGTKPILVGKAVDGVSIYGDCASFRIVRDLDHAEEVSVRLPPNGRSSAAGRRQRWPVTLGLYKSGSEALAGEAEHAERSAAGRAAGGPGAGADC